MTVEGEASAAVPPLPPWRDLCVPATELRLDPTLTCGQAFRWKVTGPAEWTCALWGQVVDLRQEPDTVMFRVLGARPGASIDVEGALRDYFQLQTNLGALCAEWARVDGDFCWKTGVRILRQPVVENLLTFIASSNNNIKRITMLVDRLCERYGTGIDTAKGRFFEFPTVADIAKDLHIDVTLRELGFGYRAPYYAKSVRLLCEEHPDPDAFLDGLRLEPADRVRTELLRLSGVGPKVADCVCLMSLDKPDTVPIDTHMWQVAQRRYVPRVLEGTLLETQPEAVALARQLRTAKAPTNKTYAVAQQLFVLLFGPYAGWAQGLLFSGDLDRDPTSAQSAKQAVAKPEKQPPDGPAPLPRQPSKRRRH
ncbi:8-oxoguanine glycosylase ogg1 [Coemansia biformis]|uniref:DNA-(apurinic or apyrimidinic site) lyase n=1 Tax=Coemansia biformis TaxID=1286918 RepID=A0A9W7YD24_9FUNG|nr:8-oxoguanine glycosylase ogg1 [Coemansia biformis]